MPTYDFKMNLHSAFHFKAVSVDASDASDYIDIFNGRPFKTIDHSILPKFYQRSGLLDSPFDHHLHVFPIIFTFPQSLSQQSEAESEINHSNPCLPLLQPTTVLDSGSTTSYLFDKSTKSLFH